MVMNRKGDDRIVLLLDECLIRISRGEAVENCLDKYPQFRQELEPLLEVAASVRSAPRVSPSAEFRSASEARLMERLREESTKAGITVLGGANMETSTPVSGARPVSKKVESSTRIGGWQGLVQAITGLRRVAIPVAVALVCALGLGLFYTGVFNVSSPPSALVSNCTLSIVSGSAEVQSPGSGVWVDAADGITLEAATRIKTAADSQVLLTFFEGSTIELEPNTELEIGQLESNAQGQTTIVLKQWLGRTWSRVVAVTDPGSRYEIQTPSAYALVRGTVFMTEVDEAGDTVVETVEGLVTVGGQDEEVDVPAGYETTVGTGIPPSQPMAAAPPAQGSGDEGDTAPNNDETSPDDSANSPDDSELKNTEDEEKDTDNNEVDTSDSDEKDSGDNEEDSSNDNSPTGPGGGGGNAPPVALTYTLTISSTDGGSVTQPDEGDTICNDGAVVDLLADAYFGYDFVNWTGDVDTVDDVNAAETTITMDGDYSITANFIRTYDLTLASSAGGSITQPGEGTYRHHDGTVVDLMAVPTTGYYFVNWTGDVDTVVNVNAATTTITVDGHHDVTANFAQITKTLTIGVSGNGSTVPAVGSHDYAVGSEVSIMAVPDIGWQFVNWTGSTGTIANVNAAGTTITMDGHHGITANFTRTYTLTVTSDAVGGSVTQPGEGTFTYEEGTVVNLLAVPSVDYVFYKWEGDKDDIADDQAASTTITMNGDYSINAKFKDD